MRVTGGTHRSRKILVPPGLSVRPTADKVRQAIFNILLKYDLPEGAVVLDAFCGSGALGIEALSRGASFCTFMDRETDYCRRNVRTLGMEDRASILTRDVLKPPALGTGTPAAALVFLDPPYEKGLTPKALRKLQESGWLASGALCVCESEKDSSPVTEGFLLLDTRTYGTTRISFLRSAI